MRSSIPAIAMAMFFVSSLAAQDQAPVNKPGLTLEETFEVYIANILEPNLEAMMTTVTKEHRFTFLTSRGALIESVEAYRKLHEEWFAEDGWRIKFESAECHEGSDYGYVLTKFTYIQMDQETGKILSSDSWATLIFHKEDGMWKLVHDAITPIRAGE